MFDKLLLTLYNKSVDKKRFFLYNKIIVGEIKMPEELIKLIYFIDEIHKETDKLWRNTEAFFSCNLKNILVKDIFENTNLENMIFNYRQFLNNINPSLSQEFMKLNITKISFRVKAQNSIEYKLTNYLLRHNNGKESIMKCLNDLYGIRIILPEYIHCEKIKEYIDNIHLKIKCTDSSKAEGYVATHLYFKIDNLVLPWELQIWDEAHEESNIACHKKYKQDYTKWELENKWR